MAKFNFYLRDGKSETETAINLFIRWDGLLLKYPIRISILPKYWDGINKTIDIKKLPKSENEKIRTLINTSASAQDLFTRFRNDNKRNPTIKELRDTLDSELFNKQEPVSEYNVLQYIDKFIDEANTRTNDKTGKPIAKGTIHTYGQLRTNLKDYCSKTKKTILFEDIDLDFYHDFHKFLINKSLATNTIGKRIAIFKTILRDATERGINKNIAYQSKRFKVTREKTENIYLNESELLKIYKLDLSDNKRLDNVRDLFLVGCYTGLRFSDLSRLNEKHITGDFIEIETQKTREPVLIPLHKIVTKIIQKHDGKLPRALTNQKMNLYLKELCKEVESLNDIVSKSITKGGKEISINYKKYELVSTHTARRSFASNLFIDGIPSQTIMKITGHKTEKSFMQYIKITPQENASIILKHWNEQTHLKIVN